MNKVNARNKWSLSVGCVGRDLCYTLVSLFLLTYLQFTGLFDTTQFLVLSVIIVLCRVWDAVNDPMMGTIITNTNVIQIVIIELITLLSNVCNHKWSIR